MRNLTNPERLALHMLGESIGSEELRMQFLKDLDGAQIEEVAPDNSRLIFHIAGLDRGPYHGQNSFRGSDGFPVEGTIQDSDGAYIEVYFYHADGRVFEVELLRPDGRPVNGPRWQLFRMK